MPLKNDLSRSLAAFEQDRTLVVVLEISLSTWLVAGLVPGVVRQPAKKLGADEHELLKLIHAGVRRRLARDARSTASASPSRQAGTVFGWLAGWLQKAWRPTSFTRRASPYPASTGARRPIGSIRNS